MEGWLVARRYALAGMALVLVTGMAFSFFWRPLHGQTGWDTTADIWTFYQGAHLLGHGHLGTWYSEGTAPVSLLPTSPGTALVNLLPVAVLVPAAMLTGALGLTDSFPFTAPHPTAWFVLGPVELLLGSTVLIALDSLAEQLGVTSSRRWALSLTGAVVVWPLVALWGHPEVGLAMAFAVAAVSQFLRGKFAACGWLFGVALVFQLLVILMVPVLIALLPSARQRAAFVLRSVIPSVALVVPGLISGWHATVHSLFQQPNDPTLNHTTPLMSFATVLNPGFATRYPITYLQHSNGTEHLIIRGWVVVPHQGEVVAAGPSRLVATALAIGIGVWVWRHRASVTAISAIWFMAACLALRCLFEPVMDPYYFVPPLLMIVFCASLTRGWRFYTAGLLAVAISIYSDYHLSPWVWYLPLVVLLLTCLAVAAPKMSELGLRRPREPTSGSAPLWSEATEEQEPAESSVVVPPVAACT
jgi:hypothetical protein